MCVSAQGQNRCTSLMSLLPKSFGTAARTAAQDTRGRNSSVGRALDWRSKGPWFDPGFRHLILFTTIFWNYQIKVWVPEISPFFLFCDDNIMIIMIINYHVPSVSRLLFKGTKKRRRSQTYVLHDLLQLCFMAQFKDRTRCHCVALKAELWRKYSNIHPTRCNVTQFILSGNCSTCFGWYLHP